MKKIICIALLLTFVFSKSIFGQIGLNISSGINHSNYEFKNFDNRKPKAKLGYFVGIAPNYRISEKVRLLTDFQYSLKGYGTDVDGSTTPSKFRFSYLEIIPEIEYSVLNYLTLGIGVTYGLKLSEQFKFGNGDWTSANNFETIKSTDFGLTGKLKVNYNDVFLFTRYNFGLKGIADVTFTDENGQEIGDANQFSRNLQIGVGYAFNLK